MTAARGLAAVALAALFLSGCEGSRRKTIAVIPKGTSHLFWLSVQAESLGPAITLDSGYEPYWAYIPHFIHSPFYVYAYAFGDCLVNSLYGVYQKAEDGFAERYMALLAAGGSKPYGELLAPFGLDARDPGFWQVGLGMIEGMIAELEEMEGQA